MSKISKKQWADAVVNYNKLKKEADEAYKQLRILNRNEIADNCPNCEGVGTVSSAGPIYDSARIEQCVKCKGKGYVEMTNEEIIKQIARWQHCDCVHFLTCGSDDCNHVVLDAIEKDGDVMLSCPECGYKQEYIPQCVLNADIDKLESGYNEIMKRLKGK